MSPTLKNTAEVVSFFDDLFDSVNGASLYSKKSKGKPLRHAVTKNSMHHTFWRDAIKKLSEIRYVDEKGKETSVPSLKNWIVTLKSYERVWQQLEKKEIKIMRPRYFNSDPIENFFGQVRSYNFRNNDPDCHTFISTFKSLLITRFIQFHSKNYNCEEDSGVQLLKLQALFGTTKENEIENNDNVPESSEVGPEIFPTSITSRQERLHVHSRAYTAGWVIRKILGKIKCRQCEDELTATNLNFETGSIHNWISFKEYKSVKEKKLTYPSENAVRFFGIITEEANEYLEKQPHSKEIIKSIKNNIEAKYSLDFLHCELHKNLVKDLFLGFTLRLAVFNWCNIINRILKGTDVVRLANKTLPAMQAKAYNKYKTKLKNKKINK